jgi:hypothetical protein
MQEQLRDYDDRNKRWKLRTCSVVSDISIISCCLSAFFSFLFHTTTLFHHHRYKPSLQQHFFPSLFYIVYNTSFLNHFFMDRKWWVAFILLSISKPHLFWCLGLCPALFANELAKLSVSVRISIGFAALVGLLIIGFLKSWAQYEGELRMQAWQDDNAPEND